MQVNELTQDEILAIIVASDKYRAGKTRSTKQVEKLLRFFGSTRISEEKKQEKLRLLMLWIPKAA